MRNKKGYPASGILEGWNDDIFDPFVTPRGEFIKDVGIVILVRPLGFHLPATAMVLLGFRIGDRIFHIPVTAQERNRIGKRIRIAAALGNKVAGLLGPHGRRRGAVKISDMRKGAAQFQGLFPP